MPRDLKLLGNHCSMKDNFLFHIKTCLFVMGLVTSRNSSLLPQNCAVGKNEISQSLSLLLSLL